MKSYIRLRRSDKGYRTKFSHILHYLLATNSHKINIQLRQTVEYHLSSLVRNLFEPLVVSISIAKARVSHRLLCLSLLLKDRSSRNRKRIDVAIVLLRIYLRGRVITLLFQLGLVSDFGYSGTRNFNEHSPAAGLVKDVKINMVKSNSE